MAEKGAAFVLLANLEFQEFYFVSFLLLSFDCSISFIPLGLLSVATSYTVAATFFFMSAMLSPNF